MQFVPELQIFIASTRPGRVGLPVAEWFAERARSHGGFKVEVVDLTEVNLPLMDEPNHPMLRQYTHDHTKRWSALVDSADAFVFVMPEYNFGFNAPLNEWRYKPVGFVSYGGVAAGTRAVQMIKQVLAALMMVPLTEAVHIPFVRQFLGEDGQIHANDVMEQAADAMLTQLGRWTVALEPLRAQVDQAV
jgi:NAD(P)H-dependent FMN reductase